MQPTLEDFFKALRGATLEPTIDAEVDAGRAVALVGWADRQQLKDALGSTLAKSVVEREVFDETFERFFAFDPFAGAPPPGEPPEGGADEDGLDRDAGGEPGEQSGEKSGEPGDDADARGESAGDGGGASAGDSGGGGGGGGGGNASGGDPEAQADALARLLLSGDQAELAQRLTRAARAVGVTDIWFRTQRGWYTQRIQQQMGSGNLNSAVATADAAGRTRRAADLRRARDRLFEEVRAFVDRQLSLYAAAPTRALHDEFLQTQSLSTIERRDLQRVREIVRRIARKLAARHARRHRRKRRGALDVRRTVRRNAAYGGVLFEPVWRSEVVDRPRVVVILDVSNSVAAYARFLLLFVYSLQEMLSGLRSFAFTSDLVEVSELFGSMSIERAIDEVMRSVSGSGTDYGRMFEDFDRTVLADIDRRTTVMILGDARNNNGEARVDLLEQIHRRARRVIWLNPESRSTWGYGDSEMTRYGVHCDLIRQCRTLRDLERVLDDLLRQGQANA